MGEPFGQRVGDVLRDQSLLASARLLAMEIDVLLAEKLGQHLYH